MKMEVTRIHPAIVVTFEDAIGGYDNVYHIGSIVHIETKRGRNVSGILKAFEESDDEMMQDMLVIETQDENEPIKKVGIHSIDTIEVI